MKKTLEMTFRNQGGNEIVLSVADPRDDLTYADANTVMQDIITKNIFSTKQGDLVQSVDVKIRQLDVVTLA